MMMNRVDGFAKEPPPKTTETFCAANEKLDGATASLRAARVPMAVGVKAKDAESMAMFRPRRTETAVAVKANDADAMPSFAARMRPTSP